MMDDYPVIGYAIKNNQQLETPIAKESGGKYAFAVKKAKILNYYKCSTKV